MSSLWSSIKALPCCMAACGVCATGVGSFFAVVAGQLFAAAHHLAMKRVQFPGGRTTGAGSGTSMTTATGWHAPTASTAATTPAAAARGVAGTTRGSRRALARQPADPPSSVFLIDVSLAHLSSHKHLRQHHVQQIQLRTSQFQLRPGGLPVRVVTHADLKQNEQRGSHD